MMMLWACAGALLAIYNVVENFNIALQIQPQILTVLSIVTWTQCYYYGKRWPIHKILLITPILCLMGGIEAALIMALRIGKSRGVEWPSKLVAGLAGFLLCAGVATHYVDIYKNHSVRGISFLFVGIDAAGDIFSFAGVIFEPSLDIAAMAVYAAEFALWSGVVGCGFYFDFLPWLTHTLRARKKTSTNDELPPSQRSIHEVDLAESRGEIQHGTERQIENVLTRPDTHSESFTVVDCVELDVIFGVPHVYRDLRTRWVQSTYSMNEVYCFYHVNDESRPAVPASLVLRTWIYGWYKWQRY